MNASTTPIPIGLVAALLAAACSSTLQPRSSDGEVDTTNPVTDGGAPDATADTGPADGGSPDATADTGPADGGSADATADTGPADGGSAGACDDIQQGYAAALASAQECTLGAPDQCATQVRAGFWCNCTTWVNGGTDRLTALASQYQAAGCRSVCNGSCAQPSSLSCVADATSATGARCRLPNLVNLSAADDGGTFSVPVGYEVDILLQNVGPNGYGNDVRLSSDAVTVIEVAIPATAPNPGGAAHLYRLRALAVGQVVVQIPFVSVVGDAGRPAYMVTLNIANGTPLNRFSCGPTFCAKGTEYCEAMVGGAATNPGSYACHPLPTGCGSTPTCACLAGSAKCGNCSASATGDLTTVCEYP